MSEWRRWLQHVPVVSFAVLVILSLTAGLTGLDPDDRWGLLRVASLIVGAGGLLSAAFLHGIRALDRRLLAQFQANREATAGAPRRPVPQAAEPEPGAYGSRPRSGRRWIPVAAGALVVSAVGVAYLGLVSVWRWTDWPSTTGYYGMLAQAFLRGETSLPIEPSAGLAELKNPYGRGSWVGVSGIANLSYYQGKYYMYWGPAPAVVLAMFMLLGVPPPGDEVVVFVAVGLIFLFSGLTIARIRRAYFPQAPTWLVTASLVAVGTIHPMLWFHGSPSVLPAAIASGQAFLLAGVYFMVRLWTEERAGAADLLAAGACWTLAMASRLTTAASVVVLVAGAAVSVWRRSRARPRLRSAATGLLPLLGALALGLLMYGRYNQIRFGNPLETGFRYALAEFDMGAELRKGTLFNLGHVPPNLVYYVFAPIRPIPNFPYVRPIYDGHPLFARLLSGINVPPQHRLENATGLACAAPLLLFAALFAWKLVPGVGERTPRVGSPMAGAAGPVAGDRMLGLVLLLAGLAGAVPVFSFFYTTTRYEMDFVPTLALVAVLGMLRLHHDTRPYPTQTRLAVAGMLLVVATGTLASLLLAVSGDASRFDDLNPALYSLLVRILPHW